MIISDAFLVFFMRTLNGVTINICSNLPTHLRNEPSGKSWPYNGGPTMEGSIGTMCEWVNTFSHL